jgi:hypothetical protein
MSEDLKVNFLSFLYLKFFNFKIYQNKRKRLGLRCNIITIANYMNNFISLQDKETIN